MLLYYYFKRTIFFIMLEIIHKKVKLNVDEILISQPLKSKK